MIAPNPLDLDTIFTEFTRLGETGNYLVLSVVCSIFGAYILLIIWARKADLQDQSKVRIIFTLMRYSALKILLVGSFFSLSVVEDFIFVLTGKPDQAYPCRLL